MLDPYGIKNLIGKETKPCLLQPGNVIESALNPIYLETTMPVRSFIYWATCFVLLLSFPGAALAGDAPQPQFAVAPDGSSLAYFDTGGEGTPLILVHGWACDSSFWHLMVEPLATELRVISVDLPGHGQSDAPQTAYTQAYFAQALLAIMDAAQVDKAVLAGHSMGASVIRFAALAAPERVSGLVIVDGALIPLPEDETLLAIWQEEMAAFAAAFSGPDSEAFTAGFIDAMHGPETTEEIKVWVREKMLATPAHVRASAMEEFIDPATWSGGPVSIPTLAIYAQSPDLPPNFEVFLADRFPNVEYHLWEGPGHFFMLERPEQLSSLILDFVGHFGN